jgi:hypothetical protein
MVVYTLDDVERIFGVAYTPEQRTALENIPFSEEVLSACVGTHVLFPGYQLSLLQVREKHADLFYSKTGGWYAPQTFAKDVQVRPSWHLLRMEPMPGSFSKTWDEQCRLLLQDEEVPSAATVAFATMLHFKASGQRLFERCYVRTSDVASVGYRVVVGGFDAGGFLVNSDWDGLRYDALGVSSARKF